MAQVRFEYPTYTDDDLSRLKQVEFADWLKFYVSLVKSTTFKLELSLIIFNTHFVNSFFIHVGYDNVF